MSYDDSNRLPNLGDLSALDKEQHDAALESYRAESSTIIQSIADAKKDLARVLSDIEQKKSDLKSLADQRVDDLNSQIGILLAQIEQKQQQSIDLDNEISKKQAAYDAVQSDFSAQKAELNSQKSVLEDQSIQLSSIQKTNTDDRAKLEVDLLSFNNWQKQTQDALDQRERMLVGRESAISPREAQLAQETIDNQAILDQVNTTKADLIRRQTALDLALAASQPLLDQADAVKMQLDGIATRTEQLNIQEKQNALDVSQIRTQQQALANKQAELRDRESAVQAAEAKIATGGN